MTSFVSVSVVFLPIRIIVKEQKGYSSSLQRQTNLFALDLFMCGDNLRKGKAVNATQIAELKQLSARTYPVEYQFFQENQSVAESTIEKTLV